MKKLTIAANEYRMHFVDAMEHERWARNLSIEDMAALVGLSRSTYHRIINSSTESIPFRVVLHVHELTGLPMWQLCGMPMPDEFKFSVYYLQLPVKQRKAVDDLIRDLIEANKE